MFDLEKSNDRDQGFVRAGITDTGSGLLEFLPSLGQREALAFGDGVPLPVRIKFDELPADSLPRSTTAHFTEHWQRSVGDEGFLEQVVERWRSSDIGAGGDLAPYHVAMTNESLPEEARAPEAPCAEPPLHEPQPVQRAPDELRPMPPPAAQPSPRTPSLRAAAPRHQDGAAAPRRETDQSGEPVHTDALKSLRDRLIQSQQR